MTFKCWNILAQLIVSR